jgi:hypothetical protein
MALGSLMVWVSITLTYGYPDLKRLLQCGGILDPYSAADSEERFGAVNSSLNALRDLWPGRSSKCA